MGPILFLYYEESLVSSNLNSKLFRFHSAHPNVHTDYGNTGQVFKRGKQNQKDICLKIDIPKGNS